MSKKLYITLIYLVCLCTVIPSSTLLAQTNVEVLIYTGKISVTTNNEVSTTYTMPSEVTELPTNTIIECIDGVAIFKVGEVQVVLEAGDKLQLFSTGEAENVNMVCVSGEIEAMYGEDFFKIDQEQVLGLSKEGTPIIEAGGSYEVGFGTQSESSSTSVMAPDPDEPIYTSSNL